MASAREITHAFKKNGLSRLRMLFWSSEGLAYEWDSRRARRARLIRLAAAVAISASAKTVPVAVLLAAAPI
jgi:hypothetical protein